MRFEDKVFFVTGAARGIGAAAARVLVRDGARVALVDVSGAALDETASHLGVDGARLLCLPLDIRDAGAVAAAVERTVRHFGRLDGALNNAAIQLPAVPLDQCPLDDFRRVLDVNLMGTVYCLQAQVRAMLAGGRAGSIVNMASGAALVALPGIAAYSASKGAVLALTRAAAVEYATRGIRVNAISPGMVYTPMTAGDTADPVVEDAIIAAHPIGRLGQPEDIAETAAWLLSDASTYLLGANIVADGGYTAQ